MKKSTCAILSVIFGSSFLFLCAPSMSEEPAGPRMWHFWYDNRAPRPDIVWLSVFWAMPGGDMDFVSDMLDASSHGAGFIPNVIVHTSYNANPRSMGFNMEWSVNVNGTVSTVQCETSAPLPVEGAMNDERFQGEMRCKSNGVVEPNTYAVHGIRIHGPVKAPQAARRF
jgi:hypothetical protein